MLSACSTLTPVILPNKLEPFQSEVMAKCQLPEEYTKLTFGQAVVELSTARIIWKDCADKHNLLVDQINKRLIDGKSKTP